VVLPLTAIAKVVVRDRVRGGSTVVAELACPGGQR